MAVEANIESAGYFINTLNDANPVGTTSQVRELDDHVRGIKNLILNSFPNISGAVTATHTHLNYTDVVAGTATASKALVLDASKNATGIGELTGTRWNGAVTGNVTGNASTASSAAQLTTARTISITGNATGSASFNGTANASISISLAANSVDSSEIVADAVGSSELNTTIASSGTQNFAISGGNVYWTPSAGIYNVMTVTGGIDIEIRVAGVWRRKANYNVIMVIADGSNLRFLTSGIATASLVWQKF